VEVRGNTEEGMENTEGVIDPEAIEGKNFISEILITLIYYLILYFKIRIIRINL
jgi:hypothetical protein